MLVNEMYDEINEQAHRTFFDKFVIKSLKQIGIADGLISDI